MPLTRLFQDFSVPGQKWTIPGLASEETTCIPPVPYPKPRPPVFGFSWSCTCIRSIQVLCVVRGFFFPFSVVNSSDWRQRMWLPYQRSVRLWLSVSKTREIVAFCSQDRGGLSACTHGRTERGIGKVPAKLLLASGIFLSWRK